MNAVDLDQMRVLLVRYVYVRREGATDLQRQRIEELVKANLLRQVWSSPDAATSIYRLEK